MLHTGVCVRWGCISRPVPIYFLYNEQITESHFFQCQEKKTIYKIKTTCIHKFNHRDLFGHTPSRTKSWILQIYLAGTEINLDQLTF